MHSNIPAPNLCSARLRKHSSLKKKMLPWNGLLETPVPLDLQIARPYFPRNQETHPWTCGVDNENISPLPILLPFLKKNDLSHQCISPGDKGDFLDQQIVGSQACGSLGLGAGVGWLGLSATSKVIHPSFPAMELEARGGQHREGLRWPAF